MRWRRSGEGLGIYGGEGLGGCWIPQPVIRREGEARIGDVAGRRGERGVACEALDRDGGLLCV
jgi:hypothetical protein